MDRLSRGAAREAAGEERLNVQQVRRGGSWERFRRPASWERLGRCGEEGVAAGA